MELHAVVHKLISALPFCFCWKSPATRHLADSMVLTMLVERTLKMDKNGSGKAANPKWKF